VPTGENQFVCVCNDDYVGDGINCKRQPRHDSNFLLVNQGMATHRIPFVPTRQNPGNPIYIAYTQMAIALDIDCLEGKAYSSDITGKFIRKEILLKYLKILLNTDLKLLFLFLYRS